MLRRWIVASWGWPWTVSILTQPEGWVLLQAGASPCTPVCKVSILTQPEGWVLHAMIGSRLPYLRLFQSSPNPKVGCYPLLGCVSLHGCIVSILTQPEGWVLRLWHVRGFLVYGSFQSSPNPKVGCYLAPQSALFPDLTVSILTQPEGWVLHPAPWRLGQDLRCFNPHPTRRLGATSP